MQIINVTLDFLRGDVISRTFLFEDDTSVTVDLEGNVVDCDGLINCDKRRQQAIEKRLKRNITV